jgi:hypothetical protein
MFAQDFSKKEFARGLGYSLENFSGRLRPFSWFARDAAGGMTYSYLSATMGSTFIARRAGM